MSDEASLDSILSGDEPEAVEEKVEQQEELALDSPEEGDKEAESKADPVTTTENSEKEEWTFAAVKDERRKRQELEKELEELKSGKVDKQEEEVSVFDDEKGFKESLRSEFSQELANTRLELAREMMMDAHSDYEEKETEFIKLAEQYPHLREQARNERNPAKFAYQQAKKYAQWQEMQNPEEARERLKAEVRQELEAELKSSQASKSSKVADLTPSLAKARSSDKETYSEPSLDEILSGS